MEPDQLAMSAKGRTRGRLFDRASVERLVAFSVSIVATVQVVWFYINKLPAYLNLDQYEGGRERMPFQARLLMQYPLRWAHTSPFLCSRAAWLTRQNFWAPDVVHPEDLVEFAIGFIAVAIAGLVARDMYRFYSKNGRLSSFVYPLFLVMVTGSYCLLTTHFFRYVYDLPSLGLFAAGLYVIYRKRSVLLFATVFVVATLNRETSLFLLVFFVLSNCVVDEDVLWRRALSWRVAGTTVLLGILWIGWHGWVARHFAGLRSESLPRFMENMAALSSPIFRQQMFGIAAYMLPILLVFKSGNRSKELQLWARVIPVWAAFMLCYGLFVEIRLFGELLPIFACMGVLLAEERIMLRVENEFLLRIYGAERLNGDERELHHPQAALECDLQEQAG